jgi:hypothetical protein
MHRTRMPPMQPLNPPERNLGAGPPATSKSSSLRAIRVPKFLRSLYDILHYEDQSILTWSKDGMYFQIFDTKRLEVAVLPKYFKHGKFSSFQRQLNNFGFRKWTKTQSSVCTFSHHHLVRCHPQHLAEFISRRPPANGARSITGSSARRKRTFTELMRTSDVAHSAAVKTFKRENDSYKRAPQSSAEATHSLAIATNPTPTKCAPRWATDPVGFLKASDENNGTPTSSTSEQTFSFSVEELHDIILPVAPMPERQDSRSVEKVLELRMLNECLDLGTTYTAATHAGDLFPALPYSWDSDLFFAPAGRTQFEHERGPWRLH